MRTCRYKFVYTILAVRERNLTLIKLVKSHHQSIITRKLNSVDYKLESILPLGTNTRSIKVNRISLILTFD